VFLLDLKEGCDEAMEGKAPVPGRKPRAGGWKRPSGRTPDAKRRQSKAEGQTGSGPESWAHRLRSSLTVELSPDRSKPSSSELRKAARNSESTCSVLSAT